MNPITVSDRAAEHIRHYLGKHGGDGLRLGVKTSGCSGFAYTVGVAGEPDESDRVFETQGVKLVVAPKSLPFLEGMELDYVTEGLNARFTFKNPNAKDHCGCGESFAI
ncbi:HesB/IscA family protein [Alkalilimnicola sp. S0819]|uniref:HesB/IscA family protein n=1 Tax=Alkalilimnicola sp. S0819 TaxID=2613922 RepID=UPI001262564A|nr:iron-sulfur cluster assembly accessory protein [Alkalilimnicola sp. S0819]KAB7628398.1 iron-sulfur cluster assembly accessory protein [Alkalilimnicola sp. S0819]MPQ15301.1 iron-sulfur cluster assembly accessory protein [Alkalilimnicola sp. S0819]